MVAASCLLHTPDDGFPQWEPPVESKPNRSQEPFWAGLVASMYIQHLGDRASRSMGELITSPRQWEAADKYRISPLHATTTGHLHARVDQTGIIHYSIKRYWGDNNCYPITAYTTPYTGDNYQATTGVNTDPHRTRSVGVGRTSGTRGTPSDIFPGMKT